MNKSKQVEKKHDSHNISVQQPKKQSDCNFKRFLSVDSCFASPALFAGERLAVRL